MEVVVYLEDKSLNEFTARIYDKNLRAVDIIKLPSTQSIMYVKQIEADKQLVENIACKDNTEGMKLY